MDGEIQLLDLKVFCNWQVNVFNDHVRLFLTPYLIVEVTVGYSKSKPVG